MLQISSNIEMRAIDT